MLTIARATVSEEPVSESISKFVIEPLEPGFGYTLGNAMRRTLLSSVPGAAITAAKIDGVLHEFTTVAGVKEDVTDIVLNLKDVVVRLEGDEATASLHLRARGAKEVVAGDIEAPAGVEIINRDSHIASLNTKGKLDIELTVSRGRGYQVADRMAGRDVIGEILVDAMFSPVRRVTYVVEHTRVEQMTNYDRLVLEVETNGAVAPKEATMHAARHLGQLVGLFDELEEGAERRDEKQAGPGPRVDTERPVEQLDLSVRALNCLKREGINTLGQLLEYSMEDLMDIRNFGEKSVVEVDEKLKEMGLGLKEKGL
ncbi:MAG TPA: DNA-directed RNA polymerase subunit alpha [Actinomycetota bacterium]|nr:DNA-directed RNA polymerase subunit alpha [Actinomycetota bacterium]